ncbi:glycoside hydrolase family 99-like domain-containing protein [Jiella sp. M17.18]|uniref:glycoside hydrolase family 99-like domain-containing protein n=1 Tax=Jiella sp. M17.18 TaxID=3234247 RepID=UPI0034E00645
MDQEWYISQYRDVYNSGIDAITHYILYGASEGRDPGPRFRTASYRIAHPSLAPNINPLVDYERRLSLHSHRADSSLDQEDAYIIPEWFDSEWYIEEYHDVRNTNEHPYDHYRRIGKSTFRAPRFDEKWYLSEYSDVAEAGIDPREHYRLYGRDECRQPAFSAEWYKSRYSDVRNSKIDPLVHYRMHGRREGRYPNFSYQFYFREYRDVVDAGFDLPKHYLDQGWGENRFPAFHHNWYIHEYSDVRDSGFSPYEHYVRIGRQQGRTPGPGKNSRIYLTPLANFSQAYSSDYSHKIGAARQPSYDGVKPIAFYLPQFHRSPENDSWWGVGFTEWTNTKKAKPRYHGHYQPRVPHNDIGYYDLADAKEIERQSELAKEYGIYGFCFYHYWFSGKRLLERPLDALIANPDIDTRFCLCWANENWTRTWDGQEADILMSQDYKLGDDLKFIKDAEPYLLDRRYIRIDGAPVLLVYKPHIIPNYKRWVEVWKSYWRAEHGERLEVWAVRTDPTDHAMRRMAGIFDAGVEFPPHVVPNSAHGVPYLLDRGLLGINDECHLFDYQGLVKDVVSGGDRSELPVMPYYRGITLGWDNSARRSEGWSAWYGFSLQAYEEWLTFLKADACKRLPKERRFLFINAWNEWGEGTYLEPDQMFGYAALEATRRVLLNRDKYIPTVINKVEPRSDKAVPRCVVHWHVFFDDLIDEIVCNIELVSSPYDLIITTDTEEKAHLIKTRLGSVSFRGKLTVIVCPNVGRDAAPMLVAAAKEILKYDLVAHFHTKKSTTVDWGDGWRKYLIKNLFSDDLTLEGIIRKFRDEPKLGVVFPPPYPLISSVVDWGGMKDVVQSIINGCGYEAHLPSIPSFPVGNMFWARVDAIRPLLERVWTWDDFDAEEGQVEFTVAHAVERCWAYVAAARGYGCAQIQSAPGRSKIKDSPAAADKRKVNRLTIFVHFSANGELSHEDVYNIRALSTISSRLVIVSNSALSETDRRKLSWYSEEVVIRENKGMDFAAWREGLRCVGWDEVGKVDELVLANNSCYGPLYDYDHVFDVMTAKRTDFWGITGFPELRGSRRPEAMHLPGGVIPKHLQSYFMVFGARVVNSLAFRIFWESVQDLSEFTEVVAAYETQLTERLAVAGFNYGCVIDEASYLQRARCEEIHFNATYQLPYELALLGAPLLKKRAWEHASENMQRAQKLVAEWGSYPADLMVRSG